MSKDKHTPGPWLAVSNRSNTAFSCIAYPDGYTLATCNNVSVGDWEANARLIAAAPDLLDALNRVMQEWNERKHLTLATRQAIDAAIAKAEARS